MVTNTDRSGTALLGRNFGDFSFHGLITAFFVFLLVSFSLSVLQVRNWLIQHEQGVALTV